MGNFPPVIALLAGNVLLVLGTGLQSVLLPVRAHLNGFSDALLGLLGAGYYLGFVLGCLATPWLVRRAGHMRAFAVLAVVAAQTFPLHAVLVQEWAWTALRLVAGFCFAGLSMAVESWINEKAANAGRGRMMSLYMILTALATASGQALLELGDPRGPLPFVLVCLCVSLSLVPLALSTAPPPRPPVAVRLHLRRLYRTSPAALAGCLSVGLANGAFWSLAPLFRQLGGGTPRDAAMFLAAAVLGGALAQWPVGRLSDGMDRRWPLLGNSLAAAAAGLALALAPALDQPWDLLAAAGFGAGAFPLYGLAVAHANDHAPLGGFVETSGGLLLTFGLGAVLGPLAATAAMSHLGRGGLFLFIAAVYLGLAGYMAQRLRRRRAQPERCLSPPQPEARNALRRFPAPAPVAAPGGPAHSPPRWGVR